MRTTDPTLRRLSDVLEYLVDRRVGIVHSVRELRRESGAPNFFHFEAEACNTRAFCREANFRRTGGTSAARGMALAKAIGEALERYCSAIYDPEELPLSSYDRADFPAVPPGRFALFSREQYDSPGFRYEPFVDDTRVRWAPARDALSGKTCFVPAEMVFVPYTPDRKAGECSIAQSISTGLACHCSPAEAALNAVCEVIERDAFTITWQARLSPPRIRVDTLDDRNADLVGRFERAGYAVTLLDITTDVGVPTVLAISRGSTPDAVPLAVAAAAAADPAQAVAKSLEELESTRAFSHLILHRHTRLDPDPDHRNVVDQDSHLSFWCDRANAHLADFLFDSGRSVEFGDMARLATGDPARDLAAVVARVHSLDHGVLLCDITTPDVRELGFAVIRAVIPGFHPLVVGHRARALGGRRLWEVPGRLGYRGISRESGDNPLPHPYP